jgi:cell division protein FtsB
MSIKDEDQDPLTLKREAGTVEPESQTTSSFVEREAQRQKRMLTFYLLLLLIPLALGIVLLKFGYSDSQMVMEEIKKQAPPIVRSEIQEQVKPAIQSEVQTQVTSSLGTIGDIKERQESLTNEFNEIKSSFSVRLTPEEIETVKRSSAIILQKEDEIKKLHQRVETLELQLKDRGFQIKPEDFRGTGREMTRPQRKSPQ